MAASIMKTPQQKASKREKKIYRNELTVREWIQRYDEGHFEDDSLRTQLNAGWYDWKCRDTTLVNKTRYLGEKLKQLAASGKIDVDTTFIFFVNEEPKSGHLTDKIRICDHETGDVLWTIVPRSGAAKNFGKSEVWQKVDEGHYERVYEGNWRGVKSMFGVNTRSPNRSPVAA